MDRVIAGSIFDAFAKLSFPPNELPPIFITCTLLAHAACDKQYVNDNICRYITLGDIASIASKKKSLVLTAEVFLRNARKLAKNSKCSPSLLHAPLLRLYANVTAFVFGKKVPAVKDVKTIEGVISLFAKDFSCITGGRIEDTQLADDDGPNLVEFDDEGEAVASHKSTIMSKGYAVGKFVHLIQKDVVHVKQMMITEIGDDGVVTIEACGTDGEPTGVQSDVAFDIFCEKYKLIKDTAVIQLANYPTAAPRTNNEFLNMNLKAVVTNALYTLSVLVDDPVVRVQEKPMSAVFAAKPYKKGALVFVPATLQVAVEANPTNATPKSTHYGAIVTGFDKIRFFLMRSTSKEFVPPIWFLRSSTNEKEANAMVVKKRITCTNPVVGAKGERTIVVTIECIENYKAIEADAEIVLITKDVKKVAEGKQVMMAIPAKKRKIGN